MDGLYHQLRAALHAVWVRRWIALAVAWGLCLAGWLVVSQIPNQYESTARVFVDVRDILPGQGGVSPVEQSKQIDRVRQTLTSSVNLEKVVRGTDLADTVSSDRDVADRVGSLQQMIKITAQQDNLFQISATVAGGSDAKSAKLSQQIVQKLIDIFVEDNLASNRDETSQSLQFLNQQLAQRQKELQDAEAKRADFQNRYLSALPGTGSLNDRISAARTELAQVNSDLAAAQSSLSAVQSQMAATGPTTPGSGATAGPAHARVAAIQGQLADARSRGWTDSHPDVIALKRQLADAQAAAKNEPMTVSGGSANPLYLQLQSMQTDKASTVASLAQRKNQLESDLSQLQAKMSEDPAVAAEQAEIERNYQVLKDQYDKLLADREQVKLKAQVQDQTDAVKFSVIDPPTAPRSPTSPNRPLLLTAVLLVGIAGGVGAAFGISKLQTRFSTIGELERASGMPVLGAVGEVVTAAQTALRHRRMRLFVGGAAALAVAYVALLGVEFVQRGMVA